MCDIFPKSCIGNYMLYVKEGTKCILHYPQAGISVA